MPSTNRYNDLIRDLFDVNLFSGIKFGLQNMHSLSQILSFPDRSFASIHVAGTNGKGSVSTKIAKSFECSGYRTGLYTSPHLSTFRERISINGSMISENEVEKLLSHLFNICREKEIPATFFELTTLLAFLYFAEQKVEIAVIETGLGGRLDATNVIRPLLSIITSISLDHTDVLGNTIELITREKGGIIKEGIPVIVGPRVPLDPLKEIIHQNKSLCIPVDEVSSLYEEENREIARKALTYLSSQFRLTQEKIEEGLLGRQPCRFEVIKGSPVTILDVAHNPDGFRSLFRMIKHQFQGSSLRILFGLSKNKDLNECLKIIKENGSHLHLVEAPNGRGASPLHLSALLESIGSQPPPAFIHDSIVEGIHEAKKGALNKNEILLICGSFFIMSEARAALGFNDPIDQIDLNERNIRPPA